MMRLLRNTEVLKGLFLYTLLSVIASAAAFLWHAGFGVFTLVLCIVMTAVHLLTVYRRYRHISELSYDIDKILHGNSRVSLGKYAEGELGILQSEIYKMTVRLREQQQKLVEDKTYLADSIADISHQIRTPLTSINLLVSFLSEPEISDERRMKLTQELYALLSRIDWLITVLLKMSKLDAGTIMFQTERIPLSELIRKTCDPLLVPIELRGQELTITADGGFSGDTAWTCEAIGNIIKNCMEHTPYGGKLEISAAENAIYTEIIISDNGSGIDKDDLPHIFERFYKGKNADDKSVGIGLALARMIITGQDGTVKVENNTSGGAKFTVRFYKGTV